MNPLTPVVAQKCQEIVDLVQNLEPKNVEIIEQLLAAVLIAVDETK